MILSENGIIEVENISKSGEGCLKLKGLTHLSTTSGSCLNACLKFSVVENVQW